jgi:hypothetical protein
MTGERLTGPVVTRHKVVTQWPPREILGIEESIGRTFRSVPSGLKGQSVVGDEILFASRSDNFIDGTGGFGKTRVTLPGINIWIAEDHFARAPKK